MRLKQLLDIINERIDVGQPKTGNLYRWVGPKKAWSNLKTNSLNPGKWKHDIPGVGNVAGISFGYNVGAWRIDDADVCFVVDRSKLNAKKIVDIPGQEVYNYTSARHHPVGNAGMADEYKRGILDPDVGPTEAFYVGIIRPLDRVLEKIIIQPSIKKKPKLLKAVHSYAEKFQIPVNWADTALRENVNEVPKLSFYNGTTGSHSGQTNGTLWAYDKSKYPSGFDLQQVEGPGIYGYVDWALYQGELQVQMIETHEDFRRKNIATQMYRELKKYTDEHGYELVWSAMTDDGSAFVKSLNEDNRRLFFARASLDPEGDIIRNFSCVYNAWVDSEDKIEDEILDIYPDDRSHLLSPRQDPNTGAWCWEPENGLSSFAFWDEKSFYEAMRKVLPYGKHIGQIAIFSSGDYDLKQGADGEDLFRNGNFVGWVSTESYSYQDFLKSVKSNSSQSFTESNDPIRPWKAPSGRKMTAIKPDGTLYPEQIKDILRIRQKVRDDEGETTGMCHIVSEILENKYGWPRWGGVYQTRDGEIICSAHLFNVLPNGALLDATADQFGEGHDIRVIQPDDPEYERYRMEWFEDYNPDLADYYPELQGVKWSGEYDVDAQDRLRRERGQRWWIERNGVSENYQGKMYQAPDETGYSGIGFWHKPSTGEYIEIDWGFSSGDDTGYHHMDYVLENPKKFGLHNFNLKDYSDTTEITYAVVPNGWNRVAVNNFGAFIDSASLRSASKTAGWLFDQGYEFEKLLIDLVPSGSYKLIGYDEILDFIQKGTIRDKRFTESNKKINESRSFNINQTTVYKDPLPGRLKTLLQTSKGFVRFVFNKDHIWIWDAHDEIHWTVRNYLRNEEFEEFLLSGQIVDEKGTTTVVLLGASKEQIRSNRKFNLMTKTFDNIEIIEDF